MDVPAAREDLAGQTSLGIAFLMTNLVLWLAIWVSSFLVPFDSAKVSYLVGILASTFFYLGYLGYCSLLRRDATPGAPGALGRNGRSSGAGRNPLYLFYIISCSLSLPMLPLLLGVYFGNPAMMPLCAATMLGVQLLLIAALFESVAYLFCALGTLEIAALTGWLTPATTYIMEPPGILAVLLISIYFVWRHNGADRTTLT